MYADTRVLCRQNTLQTMYALFGRGSAQFLCPSDVTVAVGGWGVGACIGSGFTTYLATILNVNAYTRKLLKSKSNRYVVV